ncbi:MAG: GC-type dockerin domain-anchored protein, partial [Planctomycetota bacterium]
PELAALASGFTADFDGDGETTITDFVLYLNAWSTSDARADVNLSGVVDLSDFSVYLGSWSEQSL